MDDERERAIVARLREIEGAWWGVHTSYEMNPDGTEQRIIYNAVHRHAGQHIGALADDVRLLLAEVAALRTEREAARAVLADLTRDGWAGWGANDREDRWVCFWCNADSGDDTDMSADDPPAHLPTCPMARASALLATPPGAGAVAAGEGEGA
jgi:hypothetical protein